MTMTAMIEAVRHMTHQDRIQLMHVILDEMASESDSFSLTDDEKAELDHRIADDDAHPDEGVALEDALRAARARHGR